jgi:hypothetical protein
MVNSLNIWIPVFGFAVLLVTIFRCKRPAHRTGTPLCPDAAKETLQQSRYMGTIRFAELPLFLAITGALFNAIFEEPPAISYSREILKLVGLALTLVFAWVEIILSRNILRFQLMLQYRSPPGWESISAHRSSLDWITRVALFVPYPLCAHLWARSYFECLADAYWWALSPAMFLGAILLWRRAEARALTSAKQCACHEKASSAKESQDVSRTYASVAGRFAKSSAYSAGATGMRAGSEQDAEKQKAADEFKAAEATQAETDARLDGSAG